MNRWACVVRLGGIGDNLIAAAVCAPLKRLGYMVEFIVAEPHHVVLLNNPWIDKLSVKKPERDLPQDTGEWQKWMAARAREFDVFAHMSHAVEALHAPFTHMTSFWWPAEMRRKICGGSYLESACDIAGVPYSMLGDPLYYPTQEETAAAEKTLREKNCNKPWVGWVISGTRIDKIYPYAPMAIGRMIRELDVNVLMTGAPSEKEYSSATAIVDHVIRQNGDRTGLHHTVLPPASNPDEHWGIRPVLALLQECDLVITPDTGPAWSVAMAPMPKIVMASHASERNISAHWRNTVTLHADPAHVPCWPCHRLHESIDTCVPNKENNGAACITDISVETIVQTARRLLNENPQSRIGPAERPRLAVVR